MWHCETSAQLRQNASCIIIWIESHMIHNTARAPRFAYMIQIFIQTGGPGVRIMYVLHTTGMSDSHPSTLLYPGRLTTWCLTQQKNSANKERGHLIKHCQGIMIAYDSDTDSARCLKGKQGVQVQVWQCTGASSQCWPVPQYHHQCSVVRTKCEWSEQQLDDLCYCHLDFCCLTKYPDNRDSKVLLVELTS